MQTLYEKGSVQQQIVISGATENTKNLNVLVKDAISILLPAGGADTSLTPEIVLNDNLKAPIAANSVIGTITYHVDNQSYSSDLLAETNVIASGSFPILVRIVLILVTIYLIYLLLRNPKGKNGKKVSKKKRSKKSKGKKKGNGNFRFTALNNF